MQANGKVNMNYYEILLLLQKWYKIGVNWFEVPAKFVQTSYELYNMYWGCCGCGRWGCTRAQKVGMCRPTHSVSSLL